MIKCRHLFRHDILFDQSFLKIALHYLWGVFVIFNRNYSFNMSMHHAANGQQKDSLDDPTGWRPDYTMSGEVNYLRL